MPGQREIIIVQLKYEKGTYISFSELAWFFQAWKGLGREMELKYDKNGYRYF